MQNHNWALWLISKYPKVPYENLVDKLISPGQHFNLTRKKLINWLLFIYFYPYFCLKKLGDSLMLGWLKQYQEFLIKISVTQFYCFILPDYFNNYKTIIYYSSSLHIILVLWPFFCDKVYFVTTIYLSLFDSITYKYGLYTTCLFIYNVLMKDLSLSCLLHTLIHGITTPTGKNRRYLYPI